LPSSQGANRGIGREFTKALVQRGAAKVYATARNSDQIDVPGVEVLRLDITDPGRPRMRSAARCPHVQANEGLSLDPPRSAEGSVRR
jgi:NAD(P)-dependent dehydrogenase (short-subunit alcohol dehydrogenase family)